MDGFPASDIVQSTTKSKACQRPRVRGYLALLPLLACVFFVAGCAVVSTGTPRRQQATVAYK